MQKLNTTQEPMRVNFTQQELIELARKQGNAFEDKRSAENELKAIKAKYTERIAEAENTMSSMNRQLQAGYEMKSVDVLHLKHRPIQGSQLSIRLDTGAIWKIRDLRKEETQMEISEAVPPAFIVMATGRDESTHPVEYSFMLTADEYEAVKGLTDALLFEPLAKQIEGPE